MSKNSNGAKYQEQPYRFVILACYFAATLVNSIPVHTFASINVTVQNIFHITPLQVTLNGLLFTIAHPLFAFPCNWILNKHGMKIGFIAGGILVIAGVWLRLLLEDENSTFCLLGSGLAAIGNIFVLNSPSKVAINWFKSQSVNLVAFVGIGLNLCSMTIGAAVPGFVIKKDSSSIDDVKQLLLWQAIIVTIPLVLLMIFFKNNPVNPPSKIANAIMNKKPQKYRTLMRNLFTNIEYIKLMFSMIFGFGTLTALLLILDQALKGLGYQNSGTITSNIIISALLGGLVGTFYFSFLLKKTKAYRLVSGLSTLGGFLMFSMLVLGMFYKITNTIQIIALGFFAGFFLSPIQSVIIMYASQLVFPIDQSSSAGYLLAAGQTFGFFFGLGAISILDKTQSSSKLVLMLFAGFFFLSFLSTIFVKQNLKKYKFEMQSQLRVRSKLQNSLIVKSQQVFY